MRSRDLRLIDRDDSGRKADRDTRDDSTNDKHTTVLLGKYHTSCNGKLSE